MKIFISHTFSDEDLEMAKKLQQILFEAGDDGYLAETRREYDKLIREKIIAEIKKSDHMIAILTEKTFDSASVNQELGYALREGISPIIMREKNAKQGVLTFGLDTEEFTKSTFLDSCRMVLSHIQDKGPRPKIPEDMSEVLKKVVQIEAKLNNPQSQTTGYSDKHPEVQWYNEIKKFCDENSKNIDVINEGAIPDSEELRSDVKELYSRIQMLRQDIDEISKSYEKTPVFQRATLADILRSKRGELNKLLDELRGIWTQYSD